MSTVNTPPGPGRAIIVGAGIAGLALAHRLDRHGWRVVVLERAAGPRPQGYMIDFFGPGYDAAEAMGVHTFTMKLWAFAVGASTGGLAGWVYASKVSFINPDNFPFFFSVIILAAVVLGGMGSLPGVIAGAVAIGYIPEYLRDVAAGD